MLQPFEEEKMEAGSHSSSSRKNVGNMRWRPSESKFFLQFMATQVENGLKCDKTFKPQAIHAVIRALRENFGKDCTDSNIHNHLRTLKRKWAIIRRLREMSGVGWDEENKKIIMGEEEYMTYLMSHPNEEPFINKPIEDYDLLEVVCGNDHATGRFARDSIETNPTDDGLPNFSQDNFNIGSTPEDLGHRQFDNNYGLDTPSPTPSPTPSSSQARTSQEAQTRKKGKKRDASIDSVLAQTVGSKMDRLALAIEEHNPVTLTTKLSEACMKLTEVGYSMSDVAKVYSYYADSETRTFKFLGVPDILRQYMAAELVGPPGQTF